MRKLLPLVALAFVMTSASASAATTSLIAAYDTYVPGQGFDIKLVDVGTGQDIPVPQGVNTTQDEYHPALSQDGRFLVFTRAHLQILIDGTIPPVTQWQLVMVDRQTGTVKAPVSGRDGNGDTGASITGSKLTYSSPNGPQTAGSFFWTATQDAPGFFTDNDNVLQEGAIPNDELADAHNALEFPDTAYLKRGDGRTHAFSIARWDKVTGVLVRSRLILQGRPLNPGSPTATVDRTSIEIGHPALRTSDGYVAWDESDSGDSGGISTMLFPANTSVIRAPTVVNSSRNERMPAWSPDGNKLAFTRAEPQDRLLEVFDLTSGIQDVINGGIDIGLAPTIQLRKFQSVEGNIALATETRPDSTAASCTTTCIAALRNLNLTPIITGRPPLTTKIGILVAKVTGTRTLLGKKLPKIKPIGRVPLGKVKKGKLHFKWNGKVGGKKLAKGKYLLTFRLLTSSGRVRNTSNSVPLTISK